MLGPVRWEYEPYPRPNSGDSTTPRSTLTLYFSVMPATIMLLATHAVGRRSEMKGSRVGISVDTIMRRHLPLSSAWDCLP